MNCFQLIKTVLDEAYNDIPGNEQEKDILINGHLVDMSKEYANLTSGLNVNYSDPARRFAYIYRYVTSHSNMVFELIRDNEVLIECFDTDSLKVSCIGGGPGSDLLGIIKFINNYKRDTRIFCHLLDREKLWNECWVDVDQKIDSDLRLSSNFMQMDILDPNSWGLYKKHMGADLFTMVYFLSEIYSHKGIAQVYFESLLSNIKPGAKILFIDNGHSIFYNWFDSLINDESFEIMASRERVMRMPFEEEKTDLLEYYGKFGNPKLQANVAYRIVVKR